MNQDTVNYISSQIRENRIEHHRLLRELYQEINAWKLIKNNLLY